MRFSKTIEWQHIITVSPGVENEKTRGIFKKNILETFLHKHRGRNDIPFLIKLPLQLQLVAVTLEHMYKKIYCHNFT